MNKETGSPASSTGIVEKLTVKLDAQQLNSSLDAAERLLNRINDRCKRLATFPSRGRKRDELAPKVRSFPIDDYLIFYPAIKEGIEVLRVVSGYRDLRVLFSQSDEDRACE